MAKVRIVAGRRVAQKPAPVKTAKAVEKSKKAPAPRVKHNLSGLSIKQLLRATPPYIKNNAQDVIIKALKEAKTKAGLPAVRSKTMTLGSRHRQVYETTVIGKEQDIPLSQQKHVLVSCSCDWFWSHCEYALHHWGSAVIKFSNGEPASVTNPSNQPLLCKHLVSLVKTIVEEGM